MWTRFMLVLPLAILVSAVVRLLQPFVRVRFGQFRSDRIGHFAGDPEIDICRLVLSADHRPTVLLTCFRDPLRVGAPVNSFLASIWRQRTCVIPAGLLEPILVVERFLCRGNSPFEVFRTSRDIDGVLDEVPRSWFLTDAELERGWAVLGDLGVPRGAPFVIVNARDTAYLSRLYPFSDWSYHDFRNVDIESYGEAARLLVASGYRVIRIGREVERPWSAHSGDGWIVDYSSSAYTSDFMDVFLCSECEFVISNGSGIDSVATHTFRRPAVFVSHVPLSLLSSWSRSYVVMPKHHLDVTSGERLSISQIAERGVLTAYATAAFVSAGVRLAENSAEEVAEAVSEMFGIVEGRTPPVSPLELRFREQLRTALGHEYSELHGEFRSRVPERFLATSGLLD